MVVGEAGSSGEPMALGLGSVGFMQCCALADDSQWLGCPRGRVSVSVSIAVEGSNWTWEDV